MRTTKFLAALLLGALAAPMWANGPTFDSSGNGKLAGTYYFRQVVYIVGGNDGSLSEAIALNGTFVFDGNGNYTIPSGAWLYDSSSAPYNTTSAITGTYVLSAGGLGTMSSPLNSLYNGLTDTINLTLGSGGVVMGSSTETSQGYNDMLIAALQPSPLASNGTFSGSWTMAGFLPGGNPSGAADTFFQMNPNGGGSVGTVTVSGYIGGDTTSVQTQTSNNVTYTFATGAANVKFPTSTTAPFYSGIVTLNFSSDGNFVFGGTVGAWDMIVGVRNQGAAQNFGGLYFQSGIDQDLSQFNATYDFANFDTYYGSFNATNGLILSHQRLFSVFNGAAIGSTFADQYVTPAVSPYNDTAAAIQYAYGGNGLYRIGAGIFPYLGLSVAVQAPVLSGPGVFINPDAVVNTASYSPFTAGVSAGEIVTIFGSGMSSSNTLTAATQLPLPTTLDNTQVLVYGTPASLYYVSPGQISFILPFGYGFQVAPIQVVNNSGSSNTVTPYVFNTTPGVFTSPSGGIGYAAIVDATLGTIVTPSSPANPGDIIEVFATGLGAVTPPPTPDGAAGSPGENTNATISAFVGGASASVSFAGLVPTLAALGQVNLTIPTTAAGGPNVLELDGAVGTALQPDSAAAQVLICVSGASCGDTSMDRTPAAAPRSVRAMSVKRGAVQRRTQPLVRSNEAR